MVPVVASRRVNKPATRRAPALAKGGSGIDSHLLVSEGLPTSVLVALLSRFTRIAASDVLQAIGISSKTLDRKEHARLNRTHSDAAFALAQVMETAERVLGSAQQAEQWLIQPATALNRQRPLDLLTTAPGIGAVKDLLGRIEYGVYA